MQVASVEELILCLERARREGRPVYPLSSGMNWGYGSRVPPHPGSSVLDLSGMMAIRNAAEVSLVNPVAVIEPGVTQGQLHDFLAERCSGLTFNVTGSARGTSILGNALDGGVGYLGPRRADIFGLEIVAGNGQVLTTGFRRLGEASPLAHLHPFGMGPHLDGLFIQGNFGIVTSACFRLVPRPERVVAVSLALRDERRLGELLDRLAALKRAGVMAGVTHVGNRVRAQASLSAGMAGFLRSECGLGGAGADSVGIADAELAAELARALDVVAPHEWTSLGGLSGTTGQVRAALAEVRRKMGDLARVTVVDDAKLATGLRLLRPWRKVWPWARAQAAAISAIQPLHGLASGRPTDAAITNLLARFGMPEAPAAALDDSNCGLLFISPALPMNGAMAVEVVKGMTSLAAEFQHELYVTLNIETDTSMVAVTNLLFDRSDAAAVANAHTCAKELWRYIRSRGLEVYRARADMMADIVDPDDPYWQTIWALKQVFDPDNIIAPGRYNFARAPG